jgi:hypothetical protein
VFFALHSYIVLASTFRLVRVGDRKLVFLEGNLLLGLGVGANDLFTEDCEDDRASLLWSLPSLEWKETDQRRAPNFVEGLGEEDQRS